MYQKIFNKIVFVSLLILVWKNALFAQVNADSLRIINNALQMIAFPEPEFNSPFISFPGPKEIADLGFEQPNTSQVVSYSMRDGIKIHGQKYSYSSDKTVLLLHGVLSSGYTFNKMSGLLRDVLQAEIIAIDLRGHGQSGGRAGDISTLNQYAEDLDDIITAIRKDKPHQIIILAGHSMGGGIILRYAETFPQTKVGGYLLFSPNLGINAPTTNHNMDLQNNFVKTHIARGLGLSMLNTFGIHRYDSLKVVFYNLPEQMPVRSYSYRSMQASFPQDYRETLRIIEEPLLLLAGGADEVFVAEEYPLVVHSYSQGECYVIEGETHNGIRHNSEAMERIRSWAIKNQLR